MSDSAVLAAAGSVPSGVPGTLPRRVAVVSGSSSGIGRATAVRLAALGYNLVLHGVTEDEELGESVRMCREQGADVAALAGDVRDVAVPRRLVELAANSFGRLDALVSNAGAGLTKRFVDITPEDWSSLLRVHLDAATVSCRAAYELLRESRGSIVMLSSVAATRALPGRVGYGVAKAAIEGFTRNLACEWAPEGIRVNAVAPGTVLTPLVESNLERGLLDADGVLERTPMGRFGAPSEIASVISFLLSVEASYVTGQTLYVDGGWSCWGGWS